VVVEKPVVETVVVEKEVVSEETLVIGEFLTHVYHLDPHGCNEWNCKTIGHVIHESLVTWEPGDYITPRPQVAKAWTISDDGKTYTFELRQDLSFFPSGRQLTAHDVKFSLERLKNLKLQKSWIVQPIESIEVVDDFTVKITIEAPDATFLSKLTAAELGILDAETVKAHGGTNAEDAHETDKAMEWLDQNSTGTGPYRLVRWVPNEEIVLERNPLYRGKPAYFKTIVWKAVVDPETQRLMLEQGDIDIAMNLTPDIFKDLKGKPGIEVVPGNMLTTLYLGMSPKPERNPVLSDKKVRQAINYAIDYEGISRMLGEAGHMIPTIFPNGFLGVDQEMWDIVGERTNVEKAKALLEEAGYPRGEGVSFVLSFRAESPDIEIVQKIQSDLAAVGITVELEPMAAGAFWSAYREGRAHNVFTL
ncbi:MAG: ABC transporter substrate-binding protein, partial [Deltaproteobacteria bacterium]|nr:ABC transporter substrate-binding protein [Deltaproteobacteria bacterium]